jgi:hypothetical protein
LNNKPPSLHHASLNGMVGEYLISFGLVFSDIYFHTLALIFVFFGTYIGINFMYAISVLSCDDFWLKY